MSKPKQIFLLEVSYPEGRTYGMGHSGGGIFRTERDMQMRIDTLTRRAAKAGKPVELKRYVLDAQWRALS